jgi:hypothetical protein
MDNPFLHKNAPLVAEPYHEKKTGTIFYVETLSEPSAAYVTHDKPPTLQRRYHEI